MILGDIANRVIDCGGGKTTTLMPIGADPPESPRANWIAAARSNRTVT